MSSKIKQQFYYLLFCYGLFLLIFTAFLKSQERDLHIKTRTSAENTQMSDVETTPLSEMCAYTSGFTDCENDCKSSRDSYFFKVYDKNCPLQDITRSCETFAWLHGYHDIRVTREELNFPLAFSVLMHEHPSQTEQLVRTIYRPNNVYCIHVDAKASKETFRVMKQLSTCFDNVYMVEARERMVHASFTHVSAIMKCMRILRNTDVNWKYFINLSGSDFPLKTNLEMVRILKVFNGANDIETYDFPLLQSWKFERDFHVLGGSLVEGDSKSPPPYNLKLSKGNPYGLFSRNFVDFIFNDDISKSITRWLNTTYSPALSVWATLVTLPWAPGGYPETVRHLGNTYMSRAYISQDDTQPCKGRYLRGMCLLSCEDMPWLKSRPEFFARKFSWTLDRGVLMCLEKWYRVKAEQTQGVNIDLNFYTKLPHVKYYRNSRIGWKSRLHDDDFLKQEWLKKRNASRGQ
ncbi:beta-1,3-galactosyl-O-glycosyl-glycoprotein beta-1,6-N-acetylglucosaminyltransferase-like [Mya arenaria]|uniref:beta-1,3-galactosyl-O-glycosyl-glycoprotein beta-1,6-N-acetylglucosaminyltransferase-like n=1 Tax=Mya arenaria TaxID=6604 RepID=UPI0022E0AF84|nr:beta-1,3-galactosyl-O-glycosyl-glycoprotein beta-1,6-N-acetylglucosaminyltransferase-like [Mya arenaria]